MTTLKVLGLTAVVLTTLTAQSFAQQSSPWPSMCVCKSSDPNAFATHYVAIKTDGLDMATLKARLAEIDYTPEGKTITVPSICPIPKVCTDQDKLAVDDAKFKMKILGYMADDGLVVEGKIRPEKVKAGMFLVFSGRVE